MGARGRSVNAAEADSTERGDDFVRRGEPDTGVPPRLQSGSDTIVVQATRGVLDERHLATAKQKATDCRVVADVRGDPEENDLVRVERLEHGLRVRVRKDVEVLLQQQQLTLLLDDRRYEPRRDRDERERIRVLLFRLRDLLGAAGAP